VYDDTYRSAVNAQSGATTTLAGVFTGKNLTTFSCMCMLVSMA